MIIDFDKIAEEHIEGFKGGEGKLDVRAFVDDKARIMYSTLRPGACSGSTSMLARLKQCMLSVVN